MTDENLKVQKTSKFTVEATEVKLQRKIGKVSWRSHEKTSEPAKVRKARKSKCSEKRNRKILRGF